MRYFGASDITTVTARVMVAMASRSKVQSPGNDGRADAIAFRDRKALMPLGQAAKMMAVA